MDKGGENPWRPWIDTALDTPHDIVPWQTAPAVSGSTYRAEACCGGAFRLRIYAGSGVLTTSSFERQPKLGMTASALGTLARA
jgi:hypothetical protein